MGITQFYKRKNVLVTGASGFIGKCLVEKLVRTFPDVGRIFLMIRDHPIHGTYVQRCRALLNTPLFNHLRRENPGFVDKITPVYGDLLLPQFGMKREELAVLNSDIHILFHVGATVKFSEPIRHGVKNKIVALKELCDLCRQFQHMQALVHVSTAFINIPDTDCEERLYPVDAATLLTAYEENDDAVLADYERRTKRDEGLGTYLYTSNKRMGETVIAENSTGLPLVIVRPSNVLSALREPYPGWMGASHGLGPILRQVGNGTMTMVFGDPTLHMPDIIPVDLCVNVCLAAAWYRATHVTRRIDTGDIPIFNSASGTVNPITQSEIYEYARKFSEPDGGRASIRPIKYYTNMKEYRWNALTKPLMRSYTSTGWLSMFGNEHRWKTCTTIVADLHSYAAYSGMVKVVIFPDRHMLPIEMASSSLCEEARRQYEYMRLWSPSFARNDRFTQDNVDRLQELLAPADRQLLPIDPRKIDWQTYMEDYFRFS